MVSKKKIFGLLKNRNNSTFLLSIIVFGIIFFSIVSNIFYSQDKYFQRYIYSAINTNTGFTDKVVVVAIDEKTLENLGRFPFSRDKYIDLINNLNELGASVIGFDIIFSDVTEEKIDDDFAQAIKESENVVLGGMGELCNSYVTDKSFKDLKQGECLENTQAKIKLPLEKFRNGAFAVGFFSPIVDKLTSKVYAFTPLVSYKGLTLNHFSIALYKNYLYNSLYNKGYKTNTGKSFDKYFELLDKKMLYSSPKSEDILINYVRSESITTYSFYDIYKKGELFNQLKQNNSFTGKIIIIGAEAKGIKDVFLTPLGLTYGVNVHANILNTIFSAQENKSKNYLTYFAKNMELLLIFLLIFVSIYLFLDKSIYVGLLGNIFLILLLITYFYNLSASQNILLNYPIEMLVGLLLSLTFSNILKYLLENRNKSVLIKALGEYISKDIANRILTDSGDLKLDGENKKISIFFSDIAGFTTISEKMDAEKLVEFLREYLGAMSNIIMDEKGFINKYEGDAIMVLFGVFGYEESSTYDNCKSALLQQVKLKILNKGWEKQFGEILKVRMGIHTGKAIIGNIGAKGRKMEYTALGDSVNLASRLEGVNKFYGTYICVSENVINEVGDKFEFRKLDKIRVKGKKIPIEIYELLGEKGKISDLKRDIKIGFEKALELYFAKEFKKAGEIFKKLGEIGDTASIVFSRRCFKFEISGVKDDWDGVWTMEEK